MINGNLEGIKDSILNQLEELYDYEVEKNVFISKTLADRLCYFTDILNRELSIYINRKGKVVDIAVGTHASVSLSDIDSKRAHNKLCGIRCIHTHPNGNGMLSEIDINSMLTLKLDSISAIGVSEGKFTTMYCAMPIVEDGQLKGAYTTLEPFKYNNIETANIMEMTFEIDKEINNIDLVENDEYQERAILVGVERSNNHHEINRTCDKSLKELEQLAETAGANTIEKIIQSRKTIDSAFYIGGGKAEEISLLRQRFNANLIIFDDELSGAQIRNLEQVIGTKVIDRTALILDIFAKHAKSKEGKIQVELAQLKYRLPRLTGLGTQLSRLGGGIGTRGPGEKKLEIDKRHIHRRISYLEKELEEVKKQRNLQRSQRIKNKIPVVALIGYTNSGKSTLMNSLSNAGVLAIDKLFATLDPTARKITLDSGQDILLVDTVGFIRKLPHHLVEAFKSTLEEVLYADILVHIIDSNNDEYEIQRKIVLDILNKLGASDKPTITAYNKIDLTNQEDITVYQEESEVKISAKKFIGLDSLLQMIENKVSQNYIEISGIIPYQYGHILSKIHENGTVISKEYTQTGIEIKALVDNELYYAVGKYLQ